MAKNFQKKAIEQLRNKVKERLNTIAKLKKEVPALKKAEEELDWMLDAEESAPNTVSVHQSEFLLNRLGEFDSYLTKYAIPESSFDSNFVINSSGTASSTEYINYVYRIRDSYAYDNDVRDWAFKVSDSYARLRINQARTEMARSRLSRLDNKLADLHKKASDACLAASSGVQLPMEAAVFTRELLDSFKGELIRRCKEGKGAKYERIADNLAFENTKSIVRDQQDVYDNIHAKLSGIVHPKANISQTNVQELLSLLEDHVVVVTTTLDPEKIGFEFYSS